MPLDHASYRLYNQHLSQNKFRQAADVVRCLGAIQAQDFAGAKWAIGLRAEGLTDADVEQAFNEASILRTHILRPTWHFVAPEDIRWMLSLSAPRVRAQMAYMDRRLELGTDLLKKSNALLAGALQGGRTLTRAELESHFQKAHIPAGGQRLGHLLMHAELDGVVCSGPRRGKQFTYALLDERVSPAGAMTRDDSLAELAQRYFQTRGPATVQDFAWWSGLTVTDAKSSLEMVKSRLVSETREGQTYWLAGGRLPVRSSRPATYLLPNYDEFVVGFKDRSAIAKAAEQAGIRKADQALLANVVVLNGQIIGGWKRKLEQGRVRVEASLFQPLNRAEERSLTGATDHLGRFLQLPAHLTSKEYSSGQRTSRSF